MYIFGYFNVNTLHKDNSGLAKQDFINLLSSSVFCPLITKPPRVTQNSSTLIDNIYFNIPNLATSCKAGILRTRISHHYAIFFISKKETLSSNNTIIKKRSFCDKYTYSFNNRLTNESWDFVYETDSTQLTFTLFHGVIDQHFEYNFKMQSFIINYKNRHPWMTQVLRTQIIRKNEMHTIALATNDKQNLTTTTKLYSC